MFHNSKKWELSRKFLEGEQETGFCSNIAEIISLFWSYDCYTLYHRNEQQCIQCIVLN